MGAELVATKGGQRESFDEACAIIGVEPEASWDEIVSVYRVKAGFTHPDKGGDPERFKRIQKAYEYLKKVKGPKGGKN
jgi:DnaJ family protein A protein 2